MSTTKDDQSTKSADLVEVIHRIRTERPYSGPSYDELWSLMHQAGLRPADIGETFESMRVLAKTYACAKLTEELEDAARNVRTTDFDPEDFIQRMCKAGVTFHDLSTNGREFDNLRRRLRLFRRHAALTTQLNSATALS